MTIDLRKTMLTELEMLLARVALAAEDEQAFNELFLAIGWNLNEIPNFPLSALKERIATFAQLFAQLLEISENVLAHPADFSQAFAIVEELLDQLLQLSTLYDGISVVAPEDFEKFGNDLFSYLITRHLQIAHPTLYPISLLFTLIHPHQADATNGLVDEAGNIIRLPHSWPELALENLTNLLRDPFAHFKSEYWSAENLTTAAQAKAITDKLFPRLAAVLEAIEANSLYSIKPSAGIDFGEIGNELGTGMLTAVWNVEEETNKFGLTIALSPADRGGLGWVFIPFGKFDYQHRFDDWLLEVSLTPDTEGFAIGLDGVPTLLGNNDTDQVNAKLGLVRVGDVAQPALLIGELSSSYLALQTLAAQVETTLSTTTQSYGFALETGATTLRIRDAFTLSWEQLRLSLMAGSTIELNDLRFVIDLLPRFEILADAKLVFRNGQLQRDQSQFKLHKPQLPSLPTNTASITVADITSLQAATASITDLVPTDFYFNGRCLAVEWEESNLNRWLSYLAPDLTEDNGPTKTVITARALFGLSLEEIRFDWLTGDTPRTFGLPGIIKVTAPGQGFFSLVLGGAGRQLSDLAFIYTIPKEQHFSLTSDFAWKRNNDRELQPDRRGTQTPLPLFELVLTPSQSEPFTSLVIADFDLSVPSVQGFFQSPHDLLQPLQIGQPTTLCLSTPTFKSFSGDGWTAKLHINLKELQLPFLSQGSEQFLEVYVPRRESNLKKGENNEEYLEFEVSFIDNASHIEIPLGLNVNIAKTLKLTTEFVVKFDWRTFKLDFEHGDGIQLFADNAQHNGEFLGLQWAIKGAKIEEGTNQGKYHLFTLVTDNYNYQIKQAPGSVIELSYDGISSDPIVFQVTDFAITDMGLNLRTTVVDAPVRLNGLDTKFRFDGSGIVIENSEITAFTIAGSGALPPDLVGDSRASIALQFGRLGDGNLTLVSGEAKLEGNNLLHCQGTRFQFSVDALGIKFVNDGKFHLYFTITGSAQFVLADGDEADGALALLPKIKIDLIEAPLTGDISVIGKHVKFLVELPKPVAFSFLGCFEFELRGIGFEPQAEVFAGDAAMILSGQLKFAQGGGDIIDARIDFHNLHIGLPERGSFLPRIYFKQLAVSLAISGAFKLSAVVDFRDDALEKGFLGEGMVDIQGLPSIAAAFGFLRVRRDENSPWLRAWFIYLEVRKVSFMIPVVQIYLREVGLGFGYRFTLTSIKAADQEGDIRKLLKELRALSRTQGDLSKRDRWAVDLEEQGQDPRWTIVLRAMIAQTSASALLTYSESSEKELACIYLFDAVIAFRSDFTFFMAVRGWFNTNYNDFLTDNQGLRSKPLLTGFVLLSARQKRFLAHVASNPDGIVGPHPPLPDFVKTAIEAVEFSATLLIEPGLLHYEMGWPNMLRWKGKLGPLEVEFQGGFIFRISKTELVTGTSFMARGTLSMEAGFSAGIFGVSISIFAQIAYGARYIGVLAFQSTALNSAFYGVIGLEIYITITIKFWIKLLFIKKTFKFSIGLGLTAALEVALLGNLKPGVRGQGTLSLKAMGRSIRFSVKVAINEKAVNEAIARTNKFLNIGLESTEVDALPGLNPKDLDAQSLSRASTTFVRRALATARTVRIAADVAGEQGLNAPAYTLFSIRLADNTTYFVLLPAGEKQTADTVAVEPGFLPVPPGHKVALGTDFASADEATLTKLAGEQATLPDYLRAKINAKLDPEQQLAPAPKVRIGNRADPVADVDANPNADNKPIEWLIQEDDDFDNCIAGHSIRIRKENDAFFAYTLSTPDSDFQADFTKTDGVAALQLEQFDPLTQGWEQKKELSSAAFSWRVNWRAAILEAGEDFSNATRTEEGELQGGAATQTAISLAVYLRGAFGETEAGALYDPVALDEGADRLEDSRVHNPTDNAFEAAVRGAFDQFAGSPFFKHDLNNSYDQALQAAFSPTTNIYRPADYKDEPAQRQLALAREHTDQLRGLIVHDLIADLQDYVALQQSLAAAHERGEQAATITKLEADINEFVKRSIAFQMGLVFKVNGAPPLWVESLVANESELPQIGQRMSEGSANAESPTLPIRPFNLSTTSFKTNPPRFDRVVHYTNSSTVGITWDLVWDLPPAAVFTPAQAEPEHHLMNYEVRRRALDAQERDMVFTVKSGDILHRATGAGVIEQLRPRFQFVDHFQDQTEAQRTRIPAGGLSYLYTITPVDFARDAGRPLTLVATRYPDAPPQVPVNGELTITYALDRAETLAEPLTEPLATVTVPTLVTPAGITIQWSEPRLPTDRPAVPIKTYQLVFRREATLPIGSYGLDSATQREKVKLLPTTNARTRPTDIVLTIPTAQIMVIRTFVAAGIEGTRHDRTATIALDELRRLGILPPGIEAEWRPEAWRIFFRTLSDGDVPSILAPVQLKLRVAALQPETPAFKPLPEERRPAELEWLPAPIQLPLLPPEDQKGITGDAHFPMPLVLGTALTAETVEAWRFGGDAGPVTFQSHPTGLRAIRFRWNQGPSRQPDYPLNLTAGYALLELDIDAHTNETLTDPVQLGAVLRPIQTVEMLPAADLLLTPSDTLTTNQWEAWYLSAQLRRKLRTATQAAASIAGSETPYSPWFSWRESILHWPQWPALAAGSRNTPFHPFLTTIVHLLQGENLVPANQPLALSDLKKPASEVIELVQGICKQLGLRQPDAAAKDAEQWQLTVPLLRPEEVAPTYYLRVENGQVILTGDQSYLVDLQALPPLQPQTFTDFRRTTAPSADPYGWGVLQRFGLSLTLSLRDPNTAELISQSKILAALSRALAAFDLTATTLPTEPPTDPPPKKVYYAQDFFRHLHIETLYQPGQSVALQADKTAEATQLLSLVQVSLRPVPVQQLRYTALEVVGPQGFELELVLDALTSPVSLIIQAAATGQQIELTPPVGSSAPLIHRFTLPINGKTKILLRHDQLFKLPEKIDEAAELPVYLRYRLQDQTDLPDASKLPAHAPLETIDGVSYLIFVAMPVNGPVNFEAALQKADQPMGKFQITAVPTEFAPTSEAASYFLAPVDLLLAQSTQASSRQGEQWLLFKQYAESLNSRGRDTEATGTEPRIDVPLANDPLVKDNLFAQVLSWSQRFFDHCGPVRAAADVSADEPDLFDAQFLGAWLATAYPRSGTPAYATPDAAGRLEYFHLLEDKWAHTYRYYIRPFDRYQQLWRNFYLSPLLWPDDHEIDQVALAPVVPRLADGGLDIVLDRTKPIDMPTILRSGRLDQVTAPGQPVAPGRLWEVIIAQHREQALSERNQTVYRQLSFRHVAYTLLRRFAYQVVWESWKLMQAGAFPFALAYPVSDAAALPDAIEAHAFPFDDLQKLNKQEPVRFALPQRVDNFQQGALVVQWEALPFYYAHRMLVIAQSTTQVSPVNSVIQQDFAYRAPEPADEPQPCHFYANFMDGINPKVVALPEDVDPNAVRLIQIPLRRLWDSLPCEVQQRWPAENPTLAGPGTQDRPPGLLPDPEVVYQIVEYFQGNIEVQAEIYLEATLPLAQAQPIVYTRRQLGKRQKVVQAPVVVQLQGTEAYAVQVLLQQQDEAGVFTWRSATPVSAKLEGKPEPFNKVDLDHVRLLWPGKMSAEIAVIVRDQIPGDELFKQGLARLSAAAQAAVDPQSVTAVVVTEEQVPLGLEQLPTTVPGGGTYQDLQLQELPNGAQLVISDGPNPDAEPPTEPPTPSSAGEPTPAPKTHYVALTWTGLLFADQQAQLLTNLQTFFRLTEMRVALPLLFSKISQQHFAVPYVGALDDAVIPAALKPQLQLVTLADATKELRFVGLPANQAQWAALEALSAQIDPPDAPFTAAVAQLMQLLQDATVTQPLRIPKRPTQETLAAEVRDTLVLGRSLLVYEGILSKAQAKTMADTLPLLVDKRAVERLYYLSVQANLTGRTLQLRSRRGSAEPSQLRALEPLIADFAAALPGEGENA